jgi:hypothetical protein
MKNLKPGRWKFLKGNDKTMYLKAWDFYIEDIYIGRVFKQSYPGIIPTIVYRYDSVVKILPHHWKKVPKGRLGVVSSHYETLEEAKEALKLSIIKQISWLTKE